MTNVCSLNLDTKTFPVAWIQLREGDNSTRLNLHIILIQKKLLISSNEALLGSYQHRQETNRTHSHQTPQHHKIGQTAEGHRRAIH